MYFFTSRNYLVSCLLFAFVCAGTPGAVGAGGLRFSPQRVVIDGRQRSTTLTLSNSGKKTAGYRIDMIDMLYEDDGNTSEAKELPTGYPSARPLIRFSPSQVRLAPGESQTVRILVRSDLDVPDGEYRVHARLLSLPDAADIGNSDDYNSNTVSGKIGVQQGVALAIVVRKGKTSAVGRIQSVLLAAGRDVTTLDLRLGRTGNRSLYTNIVLRDASGGEAAIAKGVALPVPNPFRRYFFQLPNITTKQLKTGNYTLELIDHDTNAVLDRKNVAF